MLVHTYVRTYVAIECYNYINTYIQLQPCSYILYNNYSIICKNDTACYRSLYRSMACLHACSVEKWSYKWQPCNDNLYTCWFIQVAMHGPKFISQIMKQNKTFLYGARVLLQVYISSYVSLKMTQYNSTWPAQLYVHCGTPRQLYRDIYVFEKQLGD